MKPHYHRSRSMDMSATVIAIMQEKGGATKTSTAVNLTGALLSLEYKVKLYDMDEKPDAYTWSQKGTELKDVVEKLSEDNPKPTIDNQRNSCDFVILDSPPNLHNSALKAALCADFIIIPCSSSQLDQDSLVRASVLATLAKKPFYYLASRVMKNTTSSRDLIKQLEDAGPVFEAQITSSVDVENSVRTGQWVGSYKPNSKSHIQYLKLAKELIAKLGEEKWKD